MVKRVAMVVYLIQEVLQKMYPWPFLDGHGHFCMEIDDIKTSRAFMFCCL